MLLVHGVPAPAGSPDTRLPAQASRSITFQTSHFMAHGSRPFFRAVRCSHLPGLEGDASVTSKDLAPEFKGLFQGLERTTKVLSCELSCEVFRHFRPLSRRPAGALEPRLIHSSTSCCSSRPLRVMSSSEKFDMITRISSSDTD